MNNQKILISAQPLRKLLLALNGPPHHIRELQALRRPPFDTDNPINILIDEFNAAIAAQSTAVMATANYPCGSLGEEV